MVSITWLGIQESSHRRLMEEGASWEGTDL